MIGVVIPAHDEEDHIGFCLQSLMRASRCPALGGEQVVLIVALDSCVDASAAIARQMGALLVVVDERNVGAARAAGAQLALDLGVRWLAFTDADSVVAPDWISSQLALQHDAVCGTVAVHDWGSYDACMQRHFEQTYSDIDGHRHIHGANLGMSAQAYQRAGGFQPLATSEDVALVAALERTGARIAWSAAPRVVTSSRRSYRAPEGFGATLERVEREAALALQAAAELAAVPVAEAGLRSAELQQ